MFCDVDVTVFSVARYSGARKKLPRSLCTTPDGDIIVCKPDGTVTRVLHISAVAAIAEQVLSMKPSSEASTEDTAETTKEGTKKTQQRPTGLVALFCRGEHDLVVEVDDDSKTRSGASQKLASKAADLINHLASLHLSVCRKQLRHETVAGELDAFLDAAVLKKKASYIAPNLNNVKIYDAFVPVFFDPVSLPSPAEMDLAMRKRMSSMCSATGGRIPDEGLINPHQLMEQTVRRVLESKSRAPGDVHVYDSFLQMLKAAMITYPAHAAELPTIELSVLGSTTHVTVSAAFGLVFSEAYTEHFSRVIRVDHQNPCPRSFLATEQFCDFLAKTIAGGSAAGVIPEVTVTCTMTDWHAEQAAGNAWGGTEQAAGNAWGGTEQAVVYNCTLQQWNNAVELWETASRLQFPAASRAAAVQ